MNSASTSLSRFRSLSLLLSIAALGLVSKSSLLAAPAAPVTRWTIDNTAKVDGHATTILGAPHAQASGKTTAVFFDGTKDGLVLETNPLAGLTQFTIEIRFRPDPDGQAEQRFFHIQDSASSRMLFEIRLTPEKQWALDTFLYRSAEHQLPLLDRTKLHPAGEWYWAALRYDGKTMSSFVNGQPELSGPVSFGPMQTTGQTSLGVRLNKVYWFKGGIAEVRIHPTALSPDQLAR